jgi:phosphatidylglycerophosphatase A
MKEKIVNFIATYCYTGNLPWFPGTWGSIFTLPLAYYFLIGDYFFNYVYLVCFLFVLGVWSASAYDIFHKTKDAGSIVIDEVVGQLIALLPLYFYGNTNLLFYLAGFILFRIFDIVKPLGIKQIQALPGGFGVMLDDVLAGLYSAVIISLGALWIL